MVGSTAVKHIMDTWSVSSRQHFLSVPPPPPPPPSSNGRNVKLTDDQPDDEQPLELGQETGRLADARFPAPQAGLSGLQIGLQSGQVLLGPRRLAMRFLEQRQKRRRAQRSAPGASHCTGVGLSVPLHALHERFEQLHHPLFGGCLWTHFWLVGWLVVVAVVVVVGVGCCCCSCCCCCCCWSCCCWSCRCRCCCWLLLL